MARETLSAAAAETWRRCSARAAVFLVVALIATGFCVAPTSAAPEISVGVYTVPATPLTPFLVPIVITDVVDLVAWQFDLAFDPLDVQVNCNATVDPCPVTEGPFTSSSGQFLTLFVPGVVDNDQGLVSLVAGAYLDLPPGPSGDGILAFVEFVATGPGTSPIVVENSFVIAGSGAVPEPSTLALLGGGVAALGAVIRRRAPRPARSQLQPERSSS